MKNAFPLLCLAPIACAPGPVADAPAPSTTGADGLPPPVSGGTLLVSRHRAWVSDPDRDVVREVDLYPPAVVREVAFEPGDEPGRLVFDGSGRVHVVLRGGGAVATIGEDAVSRRAVCSAPRGIAFDWATNALHVACATGEFVTMPADGGAPTRRLQLERDLRDVVVDGDRVLVSRFRSAEVLVLATDGSIVERMRPDDVFMPALDRSWTPTVGWRLIGLPTGGAVLVHQRSESTPIGSAFTPVYYGQDLVQTTAVVLRAGEGAGFTPAIPGATLPVDIAVSIGGRFAIAAAGANAVFTGEVSSLGADGFGYDYDVGVASLETWPLFGMPIAVAFDPDGSLWAQTRDPAGLVRVERGDGVSFSTETRADEGFDLFHREVEATHLACASCHPEGTEDGHVWQFAADGARRTQTVRGIAGSEPFHWSGDLPTFRDLVEEVFVVRMQGERLSGDRIAALERWLHALGPAATAEPVEPGAALRGRSLFEAPGAACLACHAGEALTNDATVDVGTGGAFQVPSLRGVAAREPLMHDGCAATLRDRFGPCGGDRHGVTSHLSGGDVSDLVAYLETL